MENFSGRDYAGDFGNMKESVKQVYKGNLKASDFKKTFSGKLFNDRLNTIGKAQD
jgi:hypothetical protein